MTRRFILVLLFCLLLGCGKADKNVAESPAEGPPTTYAELIAHTRDRLEPNQQYYAMLHGIEQFEQEVGRSPTNLLELVRYNYVEAIPDAGEGLEYAWDIKFSRLMRVPTDPEASDQRPLYGPPYPLSNSGSSDRGE